MQHNEMTIEQLESYLDQCFTQKRNAESLDQYEYFDKEIPLVCFQLKFKRLCETRTNEAIKKDCEGF